MRGQFGHTVAKLLEVIIRQGLAEFFRKRSQYHPVFFGLSWRLDHLPGHLHPSFRGHIGARFFRIGGRRQNDICKVSPFIPMGALINNKSILRNIFLADIIAAHDENHFGVLGRFLGKPKIQGATAGSLCVKDIESIPAQIFINHIGGLANLFHSIQDGLIENGTSPSWRWRTEWPTITIGISAFFSRSAKGCLPLAMPLSTSVLLPKCI